METPPPSTSFRPPRQLFGHQRLSFDTEPRERREVALRVVTHHTFERRHADSACAVDTTAEYDRKGFLQHRIAQLPQQHTLTDDAELLHDQLLVVLVVDRILEMIEAVCQVSRFV